MALDQEFTCPRCRTRLEQVKTSKGMFWSCQICNGRAISVELLRRIFTEESINPLWLHAIRGSGAPGGLCPVCQKPMLEVNLSDSTDVRVDVCQRCHFVWFDTGETETLTPRPMPPAPPVTPQKAREAMALFKVEQLANQADRKNAAEMWTRIPGILDTLIRI
jgi:Zn-finger nucleic acid-binding protein